MVLLLVLLAAGCGDDGDDAAPGATESPDASPGATRTSAPGQTAAPGSPPPRGEGAKLTVDSNNDVVAGDGALTLREAILLSTGEMAVADLDSGEKDQVDGDPGAKSGDVITFAGQFAGDEAIALESPLPALVSGGDTIDGSGSEGVVIDGGDRTFACLEIASSNNAVWGLQIYECRTGITVTEESAENEIGGSSEGRGNVISGNVVGMELRGQGNVIRGNLIGLDASGEQALGNEFEGIWITPRAKDNVIGGQGEGEGNVISGNELFAISVDGTTGNIIAGNLIGLNSSGTKAVENRYGITVQAGATGNVIGGSESSDRNVISASNVGLAFRDEGTTGNTVRGNSFGTDVTGEVEIPNVVDIVTQEGAGENVVEANRTKTVR